MAKSKPRTISVTELSAGHVLGSAFLPGNEKFIRQKQHLYVLKEKISIREQPIDKIVFEEYGSILQDVTISVSAVTSKDVSKLDGWISKVCRSFGSDIRKILPNPEVVSRASLPSYQLQEKQCSGRQGQTSLSILYEKRIGENFTKANATISLRNQTNRPHDI